MTPLKSLFGEIVLQSSLKHSNNNTARHRSKYISYLGNIFQVITRNIPTVKICMHKVTLASGANLGPIGQCDLTFGLGNN